ncbi:S-adenosylmethionine carrier 1, chloroplastic/mitochondrial-like isoform X2 [Glycine soja]|uniref:S-adenosylmethionine transporter n=2 Tax=Glycine subgen. Soja TaxID=1462606 RepID=A0A0R0HX76_SOYBN|nr:S-adenosylmethionine carrier 1, chloroplastic/mitochondrial isoform X2 [Glycine max]XP_028186113.1 S-adenosylmethionine carrier 1, chloroplastic/mitochondrial-like isoform X2 [Glycine soja]RZB88529.1 putative S-adenosylmethionine carrier 2, chloroplastic isoform D [Glycine soja]RZB88530.1 putative S-adenosylmethionine carrier 2, chloroplastic isoform E [Glycine soja]|eukprot:XP_014618823.1 S-adenosylmethionine carrier 1, chloroplastic/mitochondrial isoform X2 [Glycine max]
MSVQKDQDKFFLSISQGEKKPFDFLRVLYDGCIAGGAAGVVVETALYPIDTIKTRLQVARDGGKIVLKGLYSGLAGNIVGVLPASAIFIGVYEPTKQQLLKSLPENLSAVAHFAAGAIGGIASSVVRVPTEVVKQRMQIGQFKSAPDAVRLIVANEGFKGLFAAKRDPNDPENAMLGAVAGAVTGAVTTPLDVVKTRLMVQGSQNHYKGISDCVRTIVKEEGSHALFKGIGPRVLWIGIGGSIFFCVLEKTKKILAQKRHSKAETQN